MIIDLQKAIQFTKKYQKEGKTVGLVTGCFDILHIGHIELFRKAKQRLDILMVGLEGDETVRINKGKGRPVNNLSIRLEQIYELKSVDYVFPIDSLNWKNAKEYLVKITKSINPDAIITNSIVDIYSEEKKLRAKNLGIEYIDLKAQRLTSSSEIYNKLINTE